MESDSERGRTGRPVVSFDPLVLMVLTSLRYMEYRDTQTGRGECYKSADRKQNWMQI